MDNAYRASLGEIAVDAHTDAIRNGQETEPYEIQAVDAVTNILHFLRQEGELDDPERFLRMAAQHFAEER